MKIIIFITSIIIINSINSSNDESRAARRQARARALRQTETDSCTCSLRGGEGTVD